MKRILLLLLINGLTLAAMGQEARSIAGAWKLVEFRADEKDTPPSDVVLTITSSGDDIKMLQEWKTSKGKVKQRRATYSPKGDFTMGNELLVDGSPWRTKAWWEGDVLVAESTVAEKIVPGDENILAHETWTVSNSSTLIRSVTLKNTLKCSSFSMKCKTRDIRFVQTYKRQ